MIIWASESVVDFQKYYLKKNQMWIFKNLVFIGAVCIKTFEKSVKKQQQCYPVGKPPIFCLKTEHLDPPMTKNDTV